MWWLSRALTVHSSDCMEVWIISGFSWSHVTQSVSFNLVFLIFLCFVIIFPCGSGDTHLYSLLFLFFFFTHTLLSRVNIFGLIILYWLVLACQMPSPHQMSVLQIFLKAHHDTKMISYEPKQIRKYEFTFQPCSHHIMWYVGKPQP